MMSVVLTAKGEKFLQNFLPGHFKLISSLMAALSEAERKALVGLLVKVQQHATNLRAEAAAKSPSV